MGNNIALTIEGDVAYKAKFDKTPFAHGASRAAYKGKLVAPRHQAGQQVVVKKFKRDYAMHRSDWKTELQTSEKAEELAREFNGISGTNRPIHFVQPITMVVTDTPWLGYTACQEGEWVVAEGLIPGKYTKWCSNAGWVNHKEMGGGGSLPAFSHWTWVKTNGEMIVCDLQGVRSDNPMCYFLTDPAINSRSNDYGNTDLGRFGINAFFQSHSCTQFCREMGLVGNVPPPDLNPLNVFLSLLFASRRSTSYSGNVQRVAERHMKYNRDKFAIVIEDEEETEVDSELDSDANDEDGNEKEETSDLQDSIDDSELEQDSEHDDDSEGDDNSGLEGDNEDSELEDGELENGELEDGELEDGELEDGELEDCELEDEDSKECSETEENSEPENCDWDKLTISSNDQETSDQERGESDEDSEREEDSDEEAESSGEYADRKYIHTKKSRQRAHTV